MNLQEKVKQAIRMKFQEQTQQSEEIEIDEKAGILV